MSSPFSFHRLFRNPACHPPLFLPPSHRLKTPCTPLSPIRLRPLDPFKFSASRGLPRSPQFWNPEPKTQLPPRPLKNPSRGAAEPLRGSDVRLGRRAGAAGGAEPGGSGPRGRGARSSAPHSAAKSATSSAEFLIHGERGDGGGREIQGLKFLVHSFHRSFRHRRCFCWVSGGFLERVGPWKEWGR